MKKIFVKKKHTHTHKTYKTMIFEQNTINNKSKPHEYIYIYIYIYTIYTHTHTIKKKSPLSHHHHQKKKRTCKDWKKKNLISFVHFKFDNVLTL